MERSEEMGVRKSLLVDEKSVIQMTGKWNGESRKLLRCGRYRWLSADTESSQSGLERSDDLGIWLFLHLLRWFSSADTTINSSLVSTLMAGLGSCSEDGLAAFTNPSDSLPLLLPCSFGSQGSLDVSHLILRAGSITRITIRILLALDRISRTLGTSDMMATLAIRPSGRIEERAAMMTGPTDSLLDWRSSPFPAIPSGQDESRLRTSRLVGDFGCFRLRLVLLGRISMTFLTPAMLTIATGSLSPELGLATVTSSMDAHPDWLLHSLYVVAGDAGGEPFMLFEGQAVSGE